MAVETDSTTYEVECRPCSANPNWTVYKGDRALQCPVCENLLVRFL